ncbi:MULTISPECIES: tetratricopeptide repeat protein [unclassified Oleiphilus]|jgi:tetratricopeptide (TPR) repeat protein|uniref:tetratricopeptide repeat protein n=1 Tax=unclassified Oleiphilus TaxID=2631174 RepID=UPI0007C26AD9|nr:MULTISPECIES: tetratricopeptide repeat protein [unclassified Oleiphilus]KZY46480.1 Replicative DNA helicase [Oleiphilus sp. HI0050]KZY77975.1 Replicative DNA helicase [Oleiphilus sp. HI0068]KZY84195.1 Replicative DNA helicase [Oleiphilus sp. HI0069]KZZ06492.1 Replicative DNA helicase [Oleiphilus sp. HI0078]KZZ19432.1 Replicative DNA helicase [Oleiphilus sp. HI0081]KZZ46601.1 Replicative DNA helicase [Oleiphilus sp. HI0085]
MMNTKIYKAVHGLAEKLMAAAKKDDQETFDSLYSELKAICLDNEDTDKDHPVQWETLADFSEDLSDAIAIYEKALKKSVDINSKDHMSSVAYSMATLQVELGQTEEAIKNLQNAKVSANKIEDDSLKREINELLDSLASPME